MSRVRLQIPESVPVGCAIDKDGQVLMRMFFNVWTRTWGYVLYTGAYEVGVSKTRCISALRRVLEPDEHIYEVREKMAWGNRNKPAPTVEEEEEKLANPTRWYTRKRNEALLGEWEPGDRVEHAYFRSKGRKVLKVGKGRNKRKLLRPGTAKPGMA